MRRLGILVEALANLRAEASHPIRALIGRLITGNIDGAIEYIHSLAGQQNDLSQGQVAFLLRLSVHILLAVRDLEIPHNQAAADEIIREYISVLIHYHVVTSISTHH